ncbi:MAG: hypothetical protein AAFV43_15430 [Planctomycetota bacterium]
MSAETSDETPVKGPGVMPVVILCSVAAAGLNVYSRLDRPPSAYEQAAEATRERRAREMEEGLGDMHARMSTQSRVADWQSEFKVNDEDFDRLLRSAWVKTHPKNATEPWRVATSIGRNERDAWRDFAEWNYEEARAVLISEVQGLQANPESLSDAE